MANQYYAEVNGEQAGPFEVEALRMAFLFIIEVLYMKRAVSTLLPLRIIKKPRSLYRRGRSRFRMILNGFRKKSIRKAGFYDIPIFPHIFLP